MIEVGLDLQVSPRPAPARENAPREENMPVVQVYMYKGRTKAQKKELGFHDIEKDASKGSNVNKLDRLKGIIWGKIRSQTPSMEAVFSEIYRQRAWGESESVSGPGSGVERSSAFRDGLLSLLDEIGTQTLLDAGCGDFNWMKEAGLTLHRYIGVDIVSDLIAQNQVRYGSDSKTFICLDLTRDRLPQADVILCRDCLVHFSFDDIFRAVRNFKRSRSKYLLTTTFIRLGGNADIQTGGWRQLNLERAPFNFPRPLQLIDEKCLHTGGIYADKRLGLWELRAIRV